MLGAGAGQIALDSSAAYVSSPDDGGRVLAYPLAGGRPLVVADQGGSGPGIAISGDDVYFDAVTAQCDFVRSVSKAGGAVSTRASSAGSMFSAMGRMKAHAGTIYFRGGTDVVLLPASSAGPIAWLRHGAGPASRADIEKACDAWDPTRSLAKFHGYKFVKNTFFDPPSLPPGGAWPAAFKTIDQALTASADPNPKCTRRSLCER